METVKKLRYWWKVNGSKFTAWHWLYMVLFGVPIYGSCILFYHFADWLCDKANKVHDSVVKLLPPLKIK